MKIKDATGVETEVFTSAEVEAKVGEAVKSAAQTAADEAVKKYQEEHPDKSAEVTKLTNDFNELSQKLKDAETTAANNGNNDGQVQRLKEAKDAAEKSLNEFKGSVTAEINKLKVELVGDYKTDLLTRLSNGDAELKKKIEFEFDKYDANDNSKAGIERRVTAAFTIATGNKPKPGFLDGGVTSGGARGESNQAPKPGQLSDNAVAMGNQLGISDEDRKKYGSKTN